MRFFVLGATGSTGGLFVDDALAAGNEVVAYVRRASKLAPRDGLKTVEGDVLDPGELAEVMRGSDAVVSMLGLSSANPNGFSEKAVNAITAAAERSGTKRVLIMSAFGVGESADKASGLARLMYNAGGKAIYADKAAGEEDPQKIHAGLDAGVPGIADEQGEVAELPCDRPGDARPPAWASPGFASRCRRLPPRSRDDRCLGTPYRGTHQRQLTVSAPTSCGRTRRMSLRRLTCPHASPFRLQCLPVPPSVAGCQAVDRPWARRGRRASPVPRGTRELEAGAPRTQPGPGTARASQAPPARR